MMTELRLLALLGALTFSAPAFSQPTSQPPTGAWPMWGGRPGRNAVADAQHIPHEFNLLNKRNIRWVARLGTYSYGGPVVADGRVYVGSNNGGELRPGITGDKGCVLCFDERTGSLLWQATHDKLASGAANDWPEQGVASTPYVDGERVYYVSNRCELVCADVRGFHDLENDGPFREERYSDRNDADFVWLLDMVGELGVFPHNLAACSPVGAGDLVFVCTANGVDEDHEKPPKPEAPSFIAVDKRTGRVIWKRSDPGTGILHGQWSSPAYGEVHARGQVIFGGGDGWCYAFEPLTGELLWKFDLNPKDSVWEVGGRGTRSSIVATPVFVGGTVYIATGDDPESGTGPGHLYAIDATRKGDVTSSAAVWHVGGKEFGRTLSSATVADGLLYAADLDGYLYCLDAQTGKQHWRYDMQAAVWGSPCVVDGKVLLGTTDGDLVVLAHDRTLRELARNELGAAIHTTPAVANGILYVVTQRNLIAIGPSDASTTRPTTARSEQ